MSKLKVVADSHLDHNLPTSVIEHILAKYGDRTGFFIDSFELPAELGEVECNLHGPVVAEPAVLENEAIYMRRGDRRWVSRMCARKPVKTRWVTVIAGPGGDESCVLYTAYGGPKAPREPGDPDLKDATEFRKAQDFWAVHALGAL